MDILRKIIILSSLLFSTATYSQGYPLIESGGGLEEWKTATNYVLDDIVWEQEDFYKALTIHTSGVFATDLTNSEWVRMSDDLDKIGVSTDNAIVRWDGILGAAVQDSNIVIDDTDNVTGVTSLTVGAGALDGSSILDVFSTTDGTRPWPSMTTAQRDLIGTPASGLSIYNTDTNKVNVFDGTLWGAVGAGLDAWQAGFIYKTGDVVYNGGDVRFPIYKADSNFTSGGAFAPANWTELAQHVNAIPASTDETLLRWDGVTGDTIQQSGVVLTDLSAMLGLTSLTVDNLLMDGNTLSSTATNLILDAADGNVNLPDLTASSFVKTDASSNLTTTNVIDLTADVGATILPIANGGTNSSTALNDNRHLISVGGSIVEHAALTQGSVFFGDANGILEEDNANLFWDDVNNTLLIGDNTTDVSAMLELTSITKGIFLPRMTTAQRDAITVDAARDGLFLYDTDVAKYSYYSNLASAWKYIGGLSLSSAGLAVADYSEAILPHSQLTVTDVTAGQEKVRIETGNDSFLSNGSFEHSTFDDAWTISGTGTGTLEVVDTFEGSKSLKYVTTGGTEEMDLLQLKTFTQYEGNTVGAFCMIKSNSAKVKLCVGDNTDGEKDCVYHDGNNTWKQMQAIVMVDATGEMKLSIKTDDNEDAIVFVDDCRWSNDPLKIKNINVNNEFSAKISPAGIVTDENEEFLSSCTNAHPSVCTFSSNLFTVAPNCEVVLGGDAPAFCTVYSPTILGFNIKCYTDTGGSAANSYNKIIQCSRAGTDFKDASQEIITASDIVSSETMAFVFKATAVTSDDSVGTYNTFSKASSSNAFTICAAAPATLPTNIDGLYLQAVAFTAVGNCNGTGISKFKVQIGKGLKGFQYSGYASPNKGGASFVKDIEITTTTVRGYFVTYDVNTGILTVDSGLDPQGVSDHRFRYPDINNTTTNGYFHFTASKNPVVNAIQTIPIVDYSWTNDYKIDVLNNGVASVTGFRPSISSGVTVNRTSLGIVNVNYSNLGLSVLPSITALAEDLSSGRTIGYRNRTLTSVDIITSDDAAGLGDRNFSIEIGLMGGDYKERGSTAAIITQPTCFIREEQPSGGSAAGSVAGQQARVINTLSGNCPDISLLSNQITFSSDGTWLAKFCAPAFQVNRHKLAIYNPVTLSDLRVGKSAYSGSADTVANESCVEGELVMASGDKVEVRHYTQGAIAGDGLGVATSSGQIEVYTSGTLTRIK